MIVYDQTKEINRKEAVILPFLPEPIEQDRPEILAVWAVIVVALAVVGVLWLAFAK